MAIDQYYAKCYDTIKKEMPEYKVEKLFGARGYLVDEPGWPSILSDLPGYENGIEMTIRTKGGPAWVLRIGDDLDQQAQMDDLPPFEFKWKIERDRKIWWRRWNTPLGGDRWIAVAFMDWRESTLSVPQVVAKRKGSVLPRKPEANGD